MSLIYLYEFSANSTDIKRLVEGESVQVLTYTWTGVTSIYEFDYCLTVEDSTGDFSTWVQDHSIDKLFVTRYTYNDESEEVEETTKFLYLNVSSDSSTTMLRKSSSPEEHLEDAQKLIADGIVQLYEIRLADGSYLHLKQDNSVSWNGYDWKGLPILFEGYSTAQADSYSRPTLSIANPDYVNENDGNARSTLSALVLPTESNGTYYPYGLLNRAVVTRYLVLYDDLVNNRPIFQKKVWILWFIKTINKNVIQVELRNPMDGVNFDVPARMYIPPEFPFVALK